MTQTAKKLLDYLKSSPNQIFTAQGIFLEGDIDFGNIDIIERAFDDLISAGLIEEGTSYVGGRSFHLV